MTTKLKRPAPLTDAEEAQIQAEIAADPDSPELTDTQIAAGGPARDMLGPTLFAALTRRGRPKSETIKVLVTLRLDPAVLDGYRSSGPGWQVRMGEVLAAGLEADRREIEARDKVRPDQEAMTLPRLSSGGTPLRKLYPKTRKPA